MRYLYLPLLIIFLIAIHPGAIPSLQAAPNRVFNVKAEELFHWAQKQGYKSQSKSLDEHAICELTANSMLVKKRADSSHSNTAETNCQFTLFLPGTLTKGWKVQAMSVISNGRGRWRFLQKPSGTNSLKTVIHATKTGNGNFYLELKLKNIVLIGPADADTWKDAFKKK